jgi:transposase InsO family protein
MRGRFTQAAASSTLWHERLGHPSRQVLATLSNKLYISCTRHNSNLCHSCQLGKHARLPFDNSISSTSTPFELIHCDVWTLPVPSTSGFLYYLVLIDDFTHFCWTFPLRKKSEVASHLTTFVSYAHTQFGLSARAFQEDNGTEFVNNSMSSFLQQHDIALRLSCPYTSPQNGKAERMIRTINNIVRTLLIHAHMPSHFWAEALAASTYLFNRRPSSAVGNGIPFELLHHKPPSYDHLRVFGCSCYSNLSHSTT